jgi:xanthine dehydrogenase large subunit
MEDMRMTGKRHPYSADYRIGLDKDLKIVAYEVDVLSKRGRVSRFVAAGFGAHFVSLHEFLFHSERDGDGLQCRTNLPPNTAFRGFGGPQGMFVIESAIAHAAEKLGVSAAKFSAKI